MPARTPAISHHLLARAIQLARLGCDTPLASTARATKGIQANIVPMMKLRCLRLFMRACWSDCATRSRLVAISHPKEQRPRSPTEAGSETAQEGYGSPGQVFFSSFWKLNQPLTGI